MTIGITEIATVCAVLTCGGIDEIEDAPPPALMTMDDVIERVVKPKHAPYKDEETAHYERTIIELKSDIEALEGDVKALEIDLKEAKNNVPTVSEVTEEVADKDNSGNSSGSSEVGDAKESREKVKSESTATAGESFELTYYTARCAGCSGITASGLDVSDGKTLYNGMRIIAADTSLLPIDTIIRVTNPDGSSYKGIVKDRGGDIKGNRLDVLVGSKAEANAQGRHSAKVEVIN